MNDNLQNQSQYFQKPWGKVANGLAVTKTTLKNKLGLQVEFINLGGIITKILAPGTDGVLRDIVLGLDTPQDYLEKSPYMGAIIGRFSNRIRGGKFQLGSQAYQLSLNERGNHIHGGTKGFDKQLWHIAPFTTSSSSGATLSLISPDGDQGYPGELTTEIIYELTDDNELDIQMSAKTNKSTAVNLTHHSYFNLATNGTVINHIMEIPADFITPVDEDLIPTGELQPVAGVILPFLTEAKSRVVLIVPLELWAIGEAICP